MALKWAFAALAITASVWAVGSADANFGAAEGFSGRSGATCIACHTVAPFGHEPATAFLEGLPGSWTPGQSYALTLRVTGGPPAMPAPQPQGGFALASNGGRYALDAGTEALLRLVSDTEVTYRAEGTLMREWHTTWTAPDLARAPRPIQHWLAVLSANGNHVIAGGAADGGERFDSAADLSVVVPPSEAAWEVWRAIPLVAPQADGTVTGRDGSIEGRHDDLNATALGWRLDGGAWSSRDTAAAWRIALPDLEPGTHRIEVRSEGSQRRSAPVAVTLAIEGALGPLTPRGAPEASPVALSFILVCLAAAARRSHP